MMNTEVINTSIINKSNKSKSLSSRSSIETATTGAESSSDTFNCQDKIMHVAPTSKVNSPKKTPKSHRDSKGKSKDKDSKKDHLKKIVKKEMMKAWIHDDDDEEEDTVALRRSSSADLFYAMMNGEEFKPSDSFSERIEKEPHHEGEDDVLEDYFDDDKTTAFDQKSFAALVFQDEQIPVHEEDKAKPLSKTISVIDDSSRSQSSCSSTSHTGSDGLSVREIEQFVMDSMPKHVRDKIPKEAWGKIFGHNHRYNLLKPKKTLTNDDEEVQEEAETEVDNISTISAVTEATEYKVAKNGFVTKNDASFMVPASISTCSSHGSGASNPCLLEVGGQVVVTEKKDRPKRENLSVSFDTVKVRYYERIIDINPAVTNGAAVGIGWRYKRGGQFDIEEWESNRCNTRRSNELLLPKHVREAMLKDLGYSQQDIAEAVRVILKAKNKRRQTVQNLGAESVEEAVESASRRVKSILSLGMKNGLVKV
jgi:hypothetical protein